MLRIGSRQFLNNSLDMSQLDSNKNDYFNVDRMRKSIPDVSPDFRQNQLEKMEEKKSNASSPNDKERNNDATLNLDVLTVKQLQVPESSNAISVRQGSTRTKKSSFDEGVFNNDMHTSLNKNTGFAMNYADRKRIRSKFESEF